MASDYPLNTSSVNDCIIELKKIQETKSFDIILTELSESAISNDKNTWSLIYQVMRDADSGRLSWALHKDILSGFISILTKVGDSKSYRLLINYIKNLDRTIPLGAIELISDLLPTFQELDSDEIIKIASLNDEIRSAIGIIAISRLLIENKLNEEQKKLVGEVLQTYSNSKYYMKDIIESILEMIEDQRKGTSLLPENEISSLFD